MNVRSSVDSQPLQNQKKIYSEEEDITTTATTTPTKNCLKFHPMLFTNKNIFEILMQSLCVVVTAIAVVLLVFFFPFFVTVRNVLFLTIFDDNEPYNLYVQYRKIKKNISYRAILVYMRCVYTAHTLCTSQSQFNFINFT